MNNVFACLLQAGWAAACLSLAACQSKPDNDPVPTTDAAANIVLTCTSPAERFDYQIYPLGANLHPVGDVMPYYDAQRGEFTVFYLNDIWNDATNQRHPWYGLTTTNFSTYAGLPAGEALSCSTQNCAQDFALGTGSIVQKNGTYYAFYTGHNPNFPSACVSHKEGIMLATSPSIQQKFAKNASFSTIYAPTGQGFDEKDNFRDPYIFYDAPTSTYYLLVAARKNVSGTWRGVVAKYTSTNLLNWNYAGVLYDGGATNYFMLETPELFTIGDTYYLLFSDIDSKHVYYRKASSVNGPWSLPTGLDRFEGNGLYAAKSAADKYNDRYLFGWTNRLEGNTDTGKWQWGGNLVAHKLYQLPNKDLAVTIPHTLKSYLETQPHALVKHSQWGTVTTTGTTTYTLSSPADKDVANVLFNPINETRFKLSTTVAYASAAKDFGFMLGACDGYEDFYSLRFVPAQNRFRLDKVKRSTLAATTVAYTDVPFALAPNTDYNVDIIFENSMVVVYLNNTAALSAHIYRAPRTSWGIFADNSTATFKNIKVTKP